jgi:hypothetical protein
LRALWQSVAARVLGSHVQLAVDGLDARSVRPAALLGGVESLP